MHHQTVKEFYDLVVKENRMKFAALATHILGGDRPEGERVVELAVAEGWRTMDSHEEPNRLIDRLSSLVRSFAAKRRRRRRRKV